MIFFPFQSRVLNLNQWLTQNPSSPLDDLWGMKPHTTVSQAPTFWMAQHPKQFHVRTMGRGLQQHLYAQVSPSVANTYITGSGLQRGPQQHLCAQVHQSQTVTYQYKWDVHDVSEENVATTIVPKENMTRDKSTAPVPLTW